MQPNPMSMHAALIIAARRARDAPGPLLDVREVSDFIRVMSGCIRNCRADRRAFADQGRIPEEARETGPAKQVRWRSVRTDPCRRAELPRASAVPKPSRSFDRKGTCPAR